ncbi:hypothetical protein [Psychroflexus sp. ALD_RP9]|uniref:hypothetical protein n=1 Tax=Psychroflexus sp. ALD_RP9 TaxID=2777186 RepID=UPI001A8C1E74|nr:hypothetical protein [Psychroflexus sp. ALD_RP9]QSS96920.1 hypothetical protein IMZ30_10795 [Psychroflexus sp. ALD_RP9]
MWSKRNFFLLSLVCILGFSSCSTKVEFPVSEVVPSAEATAKISKDDNDNFLVEVDINNLTKPERLSPKRKFYVLWAETAQGSVNLGQIKVKESTFSSSLYAEIKASLALKPTRLVISAEDQLNRNSPSTFTILETNIRY